MGLLVKQNGNKKITIDGTALNISEVYLRVAFGANIDGKTCEVAIFQYASAEMFAQRKSIFTDVPTLNIYVVVDKGESQSIDVVLAHLKTYYEKELGYIVEIVD